MGNYVLREQLIARLGSEIISDLVSPTMPISIEEYLDFLIENSEGYINGFLNKYYTTPITSSASNGFLRELTLDFVEYEIWKRAVGDDVPTKYKTSMERAQKVLDDIGEGIIAPFDDSDRTSGNLSIDLISDTRVMGEDELSVF